MITYIDLLAVFFSLIFLGYGTWNDLKIRQVSNTVWILFLPIAIILTGLRVFLQKELILISLLSIFIIILISFLGFYSGMMGGADSKAYICIGVAMPLYPSFVNSFFHPFFPLAVFINSFIISSTVFIYSFLRNIFWIFFKKESLFLGFENEPLWKKLLVLISGYKMSVKDLERKIRYFQPIEEVKMEDSVAHRNFRIVTKVDDIDFQSFNNLMKKRTNEKLPNYVWVTPLLPMILFIILGYIITLFTNDIIFTIFRAIANS